MEIIIKILIGFGLGAGILDTVFHNKFGLAEKFQQGFAMIGTMMLSMTGIMSMAPVIAAALKPIAVPVFKMLHMDPSVLSILLSCDMGGYPLAMSLAENPKIGLMMGITTASMLGGTLTFSIPVGGSLLKKEDRIYYFKGLLIGAGCIPIGGIINGVLMGIQLTTVVWNHIPVICIAVLIIMGMKYCPDKMSRAMEKLAKAIEIIGLGGIGLGGIQYLSGCNLIPAFTPLLDSMKIVCEMGITLIGMLPMIEVLLRMIKKPLNNIGKKIGLDGIGASGLLISLVTTVPVYSLMGRMSQRGIVVNAVWTVFCSSILGSQLGLIMGIDSGLLFPFYISKFTAAFIGIAAATWILNTHEENYNSV